MTAYDIRTLLDHSDYPTSMAPYDIRISMTAYDIRTYLLDQKNHVLSKTLAKNRIANNWKTSQK